MEFYIPQLCTYLFHFNNFQAPGSAIHPTSHNGSKHQELLERFLLNKAKRSTKFAHLLYWYIIAGMDDSESIQLSQHKNPAVWKFLKTLIETVEQEILKQR